LLYHFLIKEFGYNTLPTKAFLGTTFKDFFFADLMQIQQFHTFPFKAAAALKSQFPQESSNARRP
jgi:hypothetical protein